MSDELRTEWKCWIVAHDGDGPGRLEAGCVRLRERVTGRHLEISAVEAAEHFAMNFFEDDDWAIPADDRLCIGVELDAERAIAFEVFKRIDVEAHARLAEWITPEALRPAPQAVTEGDAA